MRIRNGFNEFLQLKEKPVYLQNAIDDIFTMKNEHELDNTICEVCNAVGNITIEYRRSGASKEDMEYIFQSLCLWFLKTTITVCTGAVQNYIVSKLRYLNLLV